MDAVTLRNEVETAVNAKLAVQEPFTIVDISHPIIAKDSSVHHKEVKSVVEDLHRQGLMSSSGYTTSMVEVHPKPGQVAKARLWHPDTFDPATYQATDQQLVRAAIIQDDDGDDPNKLPTSLL